MALGELTKFPKLMKKLTEKKRVQLEALKRYEKELLLKTKKRK